MEISFGRALDQLQEIANSFMEAVPNILIGILVFILILIAGRVVGYLVKQGSLRTHGSRNLSIVMGRLTAWGVALVGLLVALSIMLPSFRGDDLVQLLGISSVAIGFAFRDILQNFLAGILLLITQPFRIHDQIVFKEFEGTVEDIQTRATLIKTYDGRRVVIPNASLYTDSVMVNTAFESRRTDYDVGIGYGDDLGKARDLILEAMHEVPEVLKDPAPDVIAMELAPSSVNLRARWWTPSRKLDTLQVRDKVIGAIKRKLTKNGIDLPFPVQTVLFHDQTEETDGDRNRQREGWPAGKGDVPKPDKIADSIRTGSSPDTDGGPRLI